MFCPSGEQKGQTHSGPSHQSQLCQEVPIPSVCHSLQVFLILQEDKNNLRMEGQVHLYTGNGKGKTTACFGLALRALCAGKKVFIVQFMKSMKYNETGIEDIMQGITIEQYGCGCIHDREATSLEFQKAKNGLERAREVLSSGDYDLVILDEICIALHVGLLTTEAVLEVLNCREEHVEVALSGRYAPSELIDYCDLVTDMQEVKHYYRKGIVSRDGIDK